MVFGSVASASSWEPFRRAIAAIAVVCFLRPWLVEKHKDLLDIIRWAPLPGPDVQFAQAKSCSKYKGILDENGHEKPSDHNIYVGPQRQKNQGLLLAWSFCCSVRGSGTCGYHFYTMRYGWLSLTSPPVFGSHVSSPIYAVLLVL